MINCVGGLPVLFPVLEQLALMTPDQQHASDPAAPSDFITPDVTTPADGDWVILPSNRASGLSLSFPRPQLTYVIETLCWHNEQPVGTNVFCLFVFKFRGSPGEEFSGHLPAGAETFRAETPDQPGEPAPLAQHWYTGGAASEGQFTPNQLFS